MTITISQLKSILLSEFQKKKSDQKYIFWSSKHILLVFSHSLQSVGIFSG